ncbi:MAG: hypothetical protein Q9177_003966, partial [Variospora cf. flavescens]
MRFSPPSPEDGHNGSQCPSPSLMLNSEMMDRTTGDKSDPLLIVVKRHPSLLFHQQDVNIVEDLRVDLPLFQAAEIWGDSRPEPLDLKQPSGDSSLSGQINPKESTTPNLTRDLISTYDTMIVPKKHRRVSRGSSQSSAISLNAGCSLNLTRSPRRIEFPGDANYMRTGGQLILGSAATTSSDSTNETDIDEPMPRILPKFSAKTALDWKEAEESSAEDENEDVITKEELDIWLRSQSGRDSTFEIFGVSFPPSTKAEFKPRNLPVEHPFCVLESYTYNGMSLRDGVKIELRDNAFMRENDSIGDRKRPHNRFMKIVDIIKDTRSQTVKLRGWMFWRAQYLNGVLEKKRNEVCWMMHVDENDCRDMKIQSMETVPVDNVIRCRNIRLTNQPFPKLSFREDDFVLDDSEDTIRNERSLVCRFMYICYYVSAERRETNDWSERSLQRLRLVDCDEWVGPAGEPCAAEDKQLRRVWRGETIPGGAFPPSRQSEAQERSMKMVRKKTIDLPGEISKQDLEITLRSSTVRDHDQPIQITGVATRSDWITAGSIENYTTYNCTRPKRPAEADLIKPFKWHRHDQLPVQIERPPHTVSMVAQLKRKSSVVEAAPWESLPRFTEHHNQDTRPINISNTHLPAPKRQYTFGDSFCGAGGMSRAAHQAGLHIKYAFDCNKNACNTYAMNFPKADLHCLWAHEFVQQVTDCKVDIAHFSPPCQFFSPAHTIAGKDDEMNTASLFAIGEILQKSKPRVVTLEQTSGIVFRERHQGYLNALIQIFTSHGFSIRWRLLNCADYGLPQMRLRTFMIAS